MNIIGFVSKYADEALATADALTTIMQGLALSPAQASVVHETIARLEKAHAAINAAIDSGDKSTAPVVKISKADIDKAVAATLPALVASAVSEYKAVAATLPALVASAVSEYMANQAVADAAKVDDGK